MPQFVTTQDDLIHLECGEYTNRPNLSWLKNTVCPHLISVSCNLDSLCHVGQTRNITAWKGFLPKKAPELVAKASSVLGSLKYLSVSNYPEFRNLVGPIDFNVILLEIPVRIWRPDVGVVDINRHQVNLILCLQILYSLTNFPNLRVLVLLQNWRKSDTTPDIVSRQGVVDCFQRLPTLEYIIHRQLHVFRDRYRFMKLSLSPDSTQDVLQEELNIYCDLAAPWWTIYNV